MNDSTISFSLPPPNEVSRLALAAREALTDQMVERLSVTGGHALELLDRLNDEQTSAAVHALIDRLTEMHKVGALDTACDLVMLAHGARSALTDNMVERLFAFVEHMVNSVANEEVGTLVHDARHALEEATSEQAKAPPPRGGMMSMLSLISKPETQASLQFLLNFAGKLQARSAGG